MSTKKTLYVCFSLDVEEEGLFSGAYQTQNPGLTNIPALKRLLPVTNKFTVPLTLFCTWPVFHDSASRNILKGLCNEAPMEIGAHLHYWSTPPFTPAPNTHIEPRVDALPRPILEEKLGNLINAGNDFLAKPITSFRMGRWDMKRSYLPILAALGIKVDSSICPLRAFRHGPDHFLAPSRPYWIEIGASLILEAPITQFPPAAALARAWYASCKNLPNLLDKFHFLAALSANPIWHALPVMKMAAHIAARQQGILNLFLHSSELMEGMSPHVPDKTAVNALLRKIRTFLTWLADSFRLMPVTVSQLAAIPPARDYPALTPPARGDW